MIVDAFLFYNEVDLLEIRLNELKEVVDLFVLVEGTRTFTGWPRVPLFQSVKDQFRNFPIRHVVVTDMPQVTDPWGRERHQRDAIVRGLDGVPDDARVLVSDVDEIPRASVVKAAAGRCHPESLQYFLQDFFYYYMTYKIRGSWRGPRMLQASTLKRLGAQWARTRGREPVSNGGWHFSYMGGVHRIQEKLRAFSHQEYNNDRYNSVAHITQVLRDGVDLFGRNQQIDRLILTTHLPAYVQANLSKFSHLIGGPE